METVDDIIRQCEDDIYTEFVAIADKFRYLRDSNPPMYRPKIIGEMTIVAELAKQSEVIRNFYYQIDCNPDEAIDALLHKAIDKL